MSVAYARIYGTVLRQAQVLACLDTVWLFTIMAASMVPLAFLMKKSVGGAAGGAH